jgi:hypothetical protein
MVYMLYVHITFIWNSFMYKELTSQETQYHTDRQTDNFSIDRRKCVMVILKEHFTFNQSASRNFFRFFSRPVRN